MNRNDFPILKNKTIYFDNGATTLKPNCLIDKTIEYYKEYSVNAHRGDYDLSLKVDELYENTRGLISKFINAKSSNQIIFTNNATDSLNKIIFGFFKNNLNNGDEVLLTKAEHASNLLPWFELKDQIGVNINYINLDDEYKITVDNVINSITEKTKVISIAHITNVVGDIRPIKEIISIAHKRGILVVIDGSQSVAHMKIDVQDLDMDFLVFSAHKMLGPTGLGFIYGKEELLKKMKPIIFGGGMNADFNYDGIREYKSVPTIFEAGTPNIAAVIGFGEVIKYLTNIKMDNIHKYEKELRTYAIDKLKQITNIIIYNENSESGIITINYKGIFSQDLAIYLNKYHICVRAGNHCAKILKDDLGIKNTVRISFYLYNTKEEIDELIGALENPNIINEII